MPKTNASRSVSPAKVTMSVERSSRQTHNQGLASKASDFLEKVMTGFGGEGSAGGDSALEKAEARYDKLEQRYEKLEEKKEKLEENNEKLRDQNAELQRENHELKVKVSLLEAELGRGPEGGYTGLFSQALQRL
jgi:DNA repair exonuclease SbcCD ATPase subunit